MIQTDASGRVVFHRHTEIRSTVRVNGYGPAPARIMCVGIRPGPNEIHVRKPFVGESGMELTRYLRLAGIFRDECFLTNVVRNLIAPDRQTEVWEIERDRPDLLTEIDAVDPEIIIALGGVPLRWFAGEGSPYADLYRMNGHQFKIPHPCREGRELWVFPTMHPAAGLRDATAVAMIHFAFMRLGRWIADGMPRHIAAKPGVYQWVDALNVAHSRDIAMDTEGLADDPYCMQVSTCKGTGYLMKDPRRLEYRPRQRWLMHNAVHDLEVARAMNVSIADDRIEDSMVMAFLLGTEPRGLKALAYRHVGLEMMEYEDIIAPANYAKGLEHLRRANAVKVWPAPEMRMQWTRDAATGELRPKVGKPHAIGRKLTALLTKAEADTAINIQSEWKEKIASHPDYEMVEAFCGPIPSATLDDVDPDIVRQYAGCDPDATRRVHRALWPQVKAMGLEEAYRIDVGIIPMLTSMIRTGMRVNVAKLQALGREMENECARIQREIRDLTGYNINPGSDDQVADMLFTKMRLDKDAKKDSIRLRLTPSGDRISTNKKILASVKKYHPVVLSVLDYRERQKIKGTYVDGVLRNLSADGRIHPRISYTSVVSGRLACREPNLLAMPVRTDLGKRVRDCFEASPGYVMCSWDLSQIEMRVMADESGDEGLIANYKAGADIYVDAALRMFNITRDFDKYEKYGVSPTLHRFPAKVCSLGMLMLMSEYGLSEQLMLYDAQHEDGSPWTVSESGGLIEGWMRGYSGVPAYQRNVQQELYDNGYVRESLGGRIRHLEGIYSTVDRVRAESWRQACAFKISSKAQAIMKIGMASVWRNVQTALGLDSVGFRPLIQIHDELIAEMRQEQYEQYKDEIGAMLTCTGDYTDARTAMKVPTLCESACAETWGGLKD